MSIGRALAWPFRRLLDPRFGGLARQADVQHLDLADRLDALHRRLADPETIVGIREELSAMREELSAMREQLAALRRKELAAMRRELSAAARADLDATRETNELLARTLGDLLAEVTATTEALEQLLGGNLRVAPTVPGTVEGLDKPTTDLLNYAPTHEDVVAERGLWLDPPISLSYAEGEVRASAANERIVELPYVYRALAGVEQGASVLDIAGTESTLAFSLASVGFRVTTVALRPYPLSHPCLEPVVADILEWETDQTFDVVICVSTLERIGLGAYGEAPAEEPATDREAIERIRELTRPGGLLILTVPFGAAWGDVIQRSYDRDALDRLLARWKLDDLTIVRQENPLTWIPDDNAGGPKGARRLALLTARRR